MKEHLLIYLFWGILVGIQLFNFNIFATEGSQKGFFLSSARLDLNSFIQSFFPQLFFIKWLWISSIFVLFVFIVKIFISTSALGCHEFTSIEMSDLIQTIKFKSSTEDVKISWQGVKVSLMIVNLSVLKLFKTNCGFGESWHPVI